MGNRMSGKEVAETMKGLLKGRVEVLEKEGITPCLTIIRVGARENDLAYEKGAKKRLGFCVKFWNCQKILVSSNLKKRLPE